MSPPEREAVLIPQGDLPAVGPYESGEDQIALTIADDLHLLAGAQAIVIIAPVPDGPQPDIIDLTVFSLNSGHRGVNIQHSTSDGGLTTLNRLIHHVRIHHVPLRAGVIGWARVIIIGWRVGLGPVFTFGRIDNPQNKQGNQKQKAQSLHGKTS